MYRVYYSLQVFFRVSMKIERYSGCEYVAESLTLVEPDVVCVHF